MASLTLCHSTHVLKLFKCFVFIYRVKPLVQILKQKRPRLVCTLVVIIFLFLWIKVGIVFYMMKIEDQMMKNKDILDKDIVFITLASPTKLSETSYYKRDPTKTNAHDYPYLINQPHFCTGLTEKPYILVQVHSRPHGQDRRSAIRDTWGSKEAFRRLNRTASIIFLVGRGKNAEEDKNLIAESEKYHDIIQEDFIDSYDNLTIKSIMGMKWAALFCSMATYTLKTDDDMFMNIAALEKILEPVNRTGIIGGALNRGSKVMRGGRWKVTEEQFPFDVFPVYCAGAAYVASLDVARVIYETSEYKGHFAIEDAYVTGVVPRIAGLIPTGLSGFPFWITRLREENLCKVISNELIGIHALPPQTLRDTWKKFLNPPEKCINQTQLNAVNAIS